MNIDETPAPLVSMFEPRARRPHRLSNTTIKSAIPAASIIKPIGRRPLHACSSLGSFSTHPNKIRRYSSATAESMNPSPMVSSRQTLSSVDEESPSPLADRPNGKHVRSPEEKYEANINFIYKQFNTMEREAHQKAARERQDKLGREDSWITNSWNLFPTTTLT